MLSIHNPEERTFLVWEVGQIGDGLAEDHERILLAEMGPSVSHYWVRRLFFPPRRRSMEQHTLGMIAQAVF